MTAGRNNQRRRRVILDEVAQLVDSAAVETAILPLEAAKPYSAAAKRRSQLKTTDMIPKRPFPLAIVVTSVLLMAVVLNVLAMGLGNWNALSGSAQQIFRFSGVGSLPNWFSSMLLVMTGMASLQIYGMRRHRCDDYNGHYQIWLFLAVLFAIGSVNCVVDFQSVFASMAKLAGFAGSNGFVVFLVAKMIAVTALVVRGILEIRASRAAFVAVIVVWIAYGSAIVVQIPDVQEQWVQNDELVVGNLVLFGNIAVFLTSLFYCRFVYLHANDLIRIEKVDVAEVADVESDLAEQNTTKLEPLEGASDGDEEQILSLARETAAKASRKKKQKKIQKQQRRAA